MSKPTPGPYTIYTASTPDGKHDGYVVMSDTDSTNVVMASFFAEGNEEQALANAEAWIVGMEAMEMLERIKLVEQKFDNGELNASQAMGVIGSILCEAKP